MHHLADSFDLLQAVCRTAGPFAARSRAATNASARAITGAATPGRSARRVIESELPLPSDYITRILSQAGVLTGVPLAYLVPHPLLLPPESIQFFAIDPGWITALRSGMLSSGAPTQIAGDDVATVLSAVTPDTADPLRGLILNSTLVTEYPNMAIRAWTGTAAQLADPEHNALAVPLMRCERLTPSILVVVFKHAPDLVTIDEPHGMVRLGMRRDDAGDPAAALRDASGALVETGGIPTLVAAPFRDNPADGVLDVTTLAATLEIGLAAVTPGNRAPDPTASSSALALQLLMPPARQRYRRTVS